MALSPAALIATNKQALSSMTGTINADALTGTINADILPNKHNRCISHVTGTAFSSSSMDPVDTTWTISNIGNSDEVMTETGGIFSFPSTGIWRVKTYCTAFNNTSTAMNMENVSWISETSTNSGSSFAYVISAHENIQYPANDWYRTSLFSDYIYDITNKDTFRFKFSMYTNPSTTMYWSLSGTSGGFYFIKLGET